MSILDEIGRKYGTDKSSLVHDYCRKYEKYLMFPRNANLTILEIGVLNGESIKMWKEYYYNSQVIGIDINPECKQYDDNNIFIEIGSQSDGDFLKMVNNKYGPFDIVIDDGSHMSSDMIFSFKTLFLYIKSEGVYIIEDTAASYWPSYGGGRYKKGTIIEYIKDLTDEVNFFGEWAENVNDNVSESLLHRKDGHLLEQFKRKGYNYIGTQIESLNILNSIVIITRR